MAVGFWLLAVGLWLVGLAVDGWRLAIYCIWRILEQSEVY